ncbi:MAG: hypothetical protein ACLFQB_05265 [Chitinispirillaceae bacterium]
MDPFKSIEQRIEDGFVLDEHGRWVHMSQKGSSEKRFMEELEKGHVLLEGKWAPIDEAKSWATVEKPTSQPSNNRNLYSPPPLTQAPEETDQESFEALETLLETKSIRLQNESQKPSEQPLEDDQNETVYLTVEEIEKSSPDKENSNGSSSAEKPKIEDSSDVFIDDDDIPEEVEQELLFNWSRSAATEQSRYAIEYIDTLSSSLRRRKIYQVLSIISISIAILAACFLAFYPD